MDIGMSPRAISTLNPRPAITCPDVTIKSRISELFKDIIRLRSLFWFVVVLLNPLSECQVHRLPPSLRQ